MLEMSAFKPLYGGQFTLSTQLTKPSYPVILPTGAAPQFFEKLTLSIQKMQGAFFLGMLIELN